MVAKVAADVRVNEIFISYSRKDKEFVQFLDGSLRNLGHDPWVDWEDIQPTEDWWAAIQSGIEKANNFIFVISPDSIASKVCRQEIEHAVLHNKRLVPIVRREGFEMQDVHPALATHNWLFIRETDNFEQFLQILVKALETDLVYLNEHTRLQTRAIEWDKKEQNESSLLRGTDLDAAEQWLTHASGKTPQPTELHGKYINAS
ncbi:MAG: toll/interleukin-1 receptor domain-containing protein, partial [Leptolyngbyaceae bacterium]|nr:toll/interleukin-1 receptor domain-containing protein [Leptolyngbyaceae bacterium]